MVPRDLLPPRTWAILSCSRQYLLSCSSTSNLSVTQLPPHQRQYPVPEHVRRVRPKTYSVAVYLVVAIIVLQVAMLISVFWLRAMVVSVNVRLPKATLAALAHAPKPTNDFPRLQSLSRLGLLTLPAASDKLEQIGNLNDEAQVFLKQN